MTVLVTVIVTAKMQKTERRRYKMSRMLTSDDTRVEASMRNFSHVRARRRTRITRNTRKMAKSEAEPRAITVHTTAAASNALPMWQMNVVGPIAMTRMMISKIKILTKNQSCASKKRV